MRLGPFSFLITIVLFTTVDAQDGAVKLNSSPSAFDGLPATYNVKTSSFMTEAYAQLYAQFMNEEMDRKGADYAIDQTLVLLGAIASAERDGLVGKAHLLNRIKYWREHNGKASRLLTARSSGAIDAKTSSLNLRHDSDDENPTINDTKWRDSFLAGEDVDENFLWNITDLINGTRRSASSTSYSQAHPFLTRMAKKYAQYAFARARFRSRAAWDEAATFEDSDREWATSFLSGALIDQNMIFSLSDLEGSSSTEDIIQKRTGSRHGKHCHRMPRHCADIGSRLRTAVHRARARARCHTHRRMRTAAEKTRMAAEPANRRKSIGDARLRHGFKHRHENSPKPPPVLGNLHHLGNHKDKDHICVRYNQYYQCPVRCKQRWLEAPDPVDCIDLD